MTLFCFSRLFLCKQKVANANNKLGTPTPSPTAKAMTSDCARPFFSPVVVLEVCGDKVCPTKMLVVVDEELFSLASRFVLGEVATGVLSSDDLGGTLAVLVCTAAATFAVAQYPLYRSMALATSPGNSAPHPLFTQDDI